MLNTHNCGELNKTHIGSGVTLAGWVDRRRDHGGLTFIDLRDREGITQVVFNPEISKECHSIASEMRNEYVILATGEVAQRPAGTENSRLPTGEIEIIVRNVEILNTSKTPPFYINEEVEIDEALRLKYRYLDLRRERMRNNLILRHNVVKFFRDYLSDKGFIEVETPILIKSTPEGARDYLVPSRLHPGKFYALPQSPQQLKQLLMVAGIEKYFQIARCFRDEDTRADRQPEHTQLDIEMSFVEEEDILALIEELFTAMVASVKPEMKVLTPFPRLSFNEAMEKYGTDKPDLRFGMEISDFSDIAARTEFSVFRSVIPDGGKVKGISAPGCAGYSRSQLNELNTLAQNCGAGGLLTISLGGSPGNLEDLKMEDVKSVAAKYLNLSQVKEMAALCNASPGDLLLIVAGKPSVVEASLNELRKEMGKRLELTNPDTLAFAFVTDFPLFEKGEKEGQWQPMHHLFTAPKEADIPLLDTAPGQVLSRHYDIVCNGYELASGSIRIHTRKLQDKIFKLLGYSSEDAQERFGAILEAFEYGAPPHGGIAPGIDRTVMLLAKEDTIREVIAFPKNQSAADLTLDAPSAVTKEQLAELRLRLVEEE
ncbi:MAG: aspartate--tRNA ligase [Dehalococcoidales bacterium]